MLCLFGHKWDLCKGKCSRCGKLCDKQHVWNEGKCTRCGEQITPGKAKTSAEIIQCSNESLHEYVIEFQPMLISPILIAATDSIVLTLLNNLDLVLKNAGKRLSYADVEICYNFLKNLSNDSDYRVRFPQASATASRLVQVTIELSHNASK